MIQIIKKTHGRELGRDLKRAMANFIKKAAGTPDAAKVEFLFEGDALIASVELTSGSVGEYTLTADETIMECSITLDNYDQRLLSRLTRNDGYFTARDRLRLHGAIEARNDARIAAYLKGGEQRV